MKRRAVYFLLCVCFCFSSLSLSSSAVDQDLIDEGWIYDESDDSYYYPYSEDMYFPSTFELTEPNYPDFDPKKLPWNEMPDYIQEVAYMGMDKANFSDSATRESIKVPFIMIRNIGSECAVFVGVNLAVGVHETSHAVRLCAHPNYINVNNSFCYSATFNSSTYEQKTEWQRRVFSAWGDKGNLTYTAATTLTTASGKFDFYFYGGNSITPTNVTWISYKIYENANDAVRIVNNTPSGFQSGTFVYQPDYYQSTYFSYFQPPSASQIEAETQKGIWESIKSIPDMIGEKLKGLFIPEEGFFDTYVSEYQNYFKDRFGLLYELPDAVMDILQQFISYSPAESGYSIHFPEVVMPVLDNGEWYDQTLIEERDITFEFLEQGAFETLYTMYRSVVWMIFVFALINLIIRKSEQVFGGGG